MSIRPAVIERFRPIATASVADVGDTVAGASREHLAPHEGI